MAAAVPFIAPAVSIISGAASIYSGVQQSQAYDAQSQAAVIEGKIAGIRGKQISASKREELNRVLAAIDTMRVSRGVGLDSPTSLAIRSAERERAKYALNAAQLGTQLEQFRAQTQAAGYRSAATLAPIAGFIQAAPSLASAAKDIGSAFAGGGT